MQKYIFASIFLVFDFQARCRGTCPYRAYRLRESFARTDRFTWQQLRDFQQSGQDPFCEITVGVKKDELFETMMLLNKPQFLAGFRERRRRDPPHDRLGGLVEEYMRTLEEHAESQKRLFAESSAGNKEVGVEDFCQHVGQHMKIQQQEQELAGEHASLRAFKAVFDD